MTGKAAAQDTQPTAAGVADAAAPAGPQSGFWRVMLSLGLAYGALSALYSGVVAVLLPLQVERIDSAHKVVVLGVVSGVSALFALVFNPVGGALSDRTRSRFGRRAPWLVAGPVALLGMLAFLGQAATVALVLIAWCLAQIVANLYQAPLTAVIPDRISRRQRGSASAVMGVASVLGGTAGVALGSRFTAHIALGYLILGLVVASTAAIFVLRTTDAPTADLPRPPRDRRPLTTRAAHFLAALRHRDFTLVFISRAASVLGYYIVISYLLYVLTDYIRLPDGLKPAEGVTVLTAISAVGALIAAAIAGPVSDRLNRRKPFVFLSSGVTGIGAILPVLSPTFRTLEIFAAFAGIAFGCYLSVDSALVTLVLPRGEDAARDLGVLNIANAGPQVIAPLLAAVIISNLGGYRTLFIAGGLCAVTGALAVMPVRSVR